MFPTHIGKAAATGFVVAAIFGASNVVAGGNSDDEAPASFIYDCTGLAGPVSVMFVDGETPTAVLRWADRKIVLAHGVSASGARYVRYGDGGKIIEFWIKGREAMFIMDGARHDCRTGNGS